jgi:hypothetical protein
MRRTKIAAAAVAVSMLGGAGVGFALSIPATATAQDTTPTTPTTPEPKATPPWMTDALKKLVDAGTITQAQADAVAKSLTEAAPARGPGHGPGHGPHGDKGEDLSIAAKAIGMTADALRNELQSGTSIADVAKAHNVDVQKVIDALVADKEAKLAQAVKDGRLTQAQADQKKAELPQRMTELVNGTFRGHGRGGPGGHHDGPPPAAPSTGVTPSSF